MTEETALPAPDELLTELWRVYDDGDFPGLCRLAEREVAGYPDRADLRAVQAHCLLWSGQTDEARAAVRKAQEIDPHSAMALAAEAQVAAFEGLSEEATEAAAKALRLDSTGRWVLEWASGAYGAGGDAETALQVVDRARKLYSRESHWVALAVTLLHNAGKTEEAAAALAEGEARFPDCPRFWVFRARLQMREGRLREALALLQRATLAVPGSALYWGEMAGLLSHLRQVDEAEAAARRALEISRCSVSAMTALARVCGLRGDKAGAAEWERRAAEAIPALAYAQHTRAATAAMGRGDWYGVLKAIEPALTAPSAMARQVARTIRIRALLALRRTGQADEELRALEGSGYQAPVLCEVKAEARLAHRDRAGAIAVCREGVRQYPGNGPLRALLLRLLAKRSLWQALLRREPVPGAQQEAQALVVHLLQFPPETPSQIVAACAAMWETGYRNEARQLRATGERLFPEAREFRLLDAYSRAELHDFRGAREVIKEYRREQQEGGQEPSGEVKPPGRQ